MAGRAVSGRRGRSARRPADIGRQPGEEARRLRRSIQALVRRFSISQRADTSCCGMTVAQAATLEALRSGGPGRLGDLGQRLGISPSTLTRNLARLEQRGLVSRRADPKDARAFHVALTAAGQAAADRVDRQEAAFARTILERLPGGRSRAVLASLEHLLRAVRGATDRCCPGAFDHLMEDFPRENSRARRKTQ